MFNRFKYYFFTLFGIGNLPASGTCASLFTVIIFFLFLKNINFYQYIFIILIILIISLLFLESFLKNYKKEDPKEVVIDEVIGQLIALINVGQNLKLIILSFILFRFFDITKVYPASYFDKKLKNKYGILGDDIVAGIYAFLVVYLIKNYYHV